MARVARARHASEGPLLVKQFGRLCRVERDRTYRCSLACLDVFLALLSHCQGYVSAPNSAFQLTDCALCSLWAITMDLSAAKSTDSPAMAMA